VAMRQFYPSNVINPSGPPLTTTTHPDGETTHPNPDVVKETSKEVSRDVMLTTPPVPTKFKGSVDIVVFDPGDPRRQNVRLNQPGVLPLKPGDRFAVEAEITPPAHLYILWIDADGSVDPVYPWRRGRWDDLPAEERPAGSVRRPIPSDRPFGGTFSIKESVQGMETLVLLARKTPLPADVDLKAKLGEVRPQTLRTLQAAAWFENGRLVTNEPSRSAVEWGEEKEDDPVWATQKQIEAKLGRLFPYTRAVSFAVRGK
jgi:hypothetical protein